MSLINYKDIDFNKSIDKTNKVISFNEQEIEIVNYLSADDKYDLIMITLQKSLDRNVYNPFKIDMYFDLNIIYLYTNIVFSMEDRADENKLYDTLKRSGLIDAVKAEIDQEELFDLKSYIWQLVDIITKYRNTFGTILGTLVEQLPENMEKAKNILDNLDPEKFQTLFAISNQLNNKNVTE